MPEKRIFFISRAGADKRWAELIASVVKDAGHEAIHQEDFRIGASFIHNMRAASTNSDCTIAVLSPTYFQSQHCLAELNAALAPDPNGLRGQILPVLVAPCELPPDLAHLSYLDLVGADDDNARQRLLRTLLKHGQMDASKLAVVGRTRRVVAQANRNRSAMIEKVRTIWITGFLQQSLFHETRILLGLSERPDAVARPLDLLVKRPDQGERPLPSGTQVVDVFDSMDQSLLILGAPGSGKTTLLLELARDLLDRTEGDAAHPIPVVFPLSTWAESRKPLVDWLQDELNLRYDVPHAIAQEWVASDQVLPLLDGLDEVKAEHRAACVEAINAFRQSHGLLPLVITSRTADYEALAEPLRLQGAILVQPLTPEQVKVYLNDLGPAGEPVRSAIHEDPSLWELLDSPLLLNIVTVAYAGQVVTPLPTNGAGDKRRDQLFGLYVDQMLRRRTAERRYTLEQTAHWLSWLAYQMGDHGETVFYLERLQLHWLPQRERKTIRACNSLVVGLVFGIVGVLVCPMFEQVFGLVVGLVGGLMVGWSRFPEEIVCVETVRWSWSEFRQSVSSILVAGLGCGMLVGLVGGLAQGWLGFGLVVGLGFGLVVVLVFALSAGMTFSEIETKVVPNEGIHRSSRNAVVVGLVGGLIGGLVVGLVVGLIMGLVVGPFGARYLGQYGGLGFGLVFGLHAGGEVCLKNLVLRLWLIRNGSTPWNYVRFLNHAAEKILLRKVGGGYAFIHRMLLEHFAARYVEPSVEGMPPPKPFPIDEEL